MTTRKELKAQLEDNTEELINLTRLLAETFKNSSIDTNELTV